MNKVKIPQGKSPNYILPGCLCRATCNSEILCPVLKKKKRCLLSRNSGAASPAVSIIEKTWMLASPEFPSRVVSPTATLQGIRVDRWSQVLSPGWFWIQCLGSESILRTISLQFQMILWFDRGNLDGLPKPLKCLDGVCCVYRLLQGEPVTVNYLPFVASHQPPNLHHLPYAFMGVQRSAWCACK